MLLAFLFAFPPVGESFMITPAPIEFELAVSVKPWIYFEKSFTFEGVTNAGVASFDRGR